MQIQGQVLEQEVPKNKPNLQMNINGWELAPGQLQKMNDPNVDTVKFQKRQQKRKIFQDIKVSYEPIELMFDFMKQKQPQLDTYETAYLQQQGVQN